VCSYSGFWGTKMTLTVDKRYAEAKRRLATDDARAVRHQFATEFGEKRGNLFLSKVLEALNTTFPEAKTTRGKASRKSVTRA
jgi:hypothetical protein